MFNSLYKIREAPLLLVFLVPPLLFLSTLMTGCSTKEDPTAPLITSMKEKGPLALSGDNPYLAPNEFIYQVKEESNSVKGFLASRGLPDAVVVSGSTLTSELIQLLYVAPYEAYTLEKVDERWIILGPQSFPHTHRVAVKRAVANRTSEPMILGMKQSEMTPRDPTTPSFSQPEMMKDQGMSNNPQPLIPEIAPPDDTISVSPADSVMDKVKALHKDLGLEDVIRTPIGDIEHVVRSNDETIALLSLWYTADIENKGRIARMNRRHENSKLTPGDTLIIPRYLALTFKSLPRQAIPKLRELQ